MKEDGYALVEEMGVETVWMGREEEGRWATWRRTATSGYENEGGRGGDLGRGRRCQSKKREREVAEGER